MKKKLLVIVLFIVFPLVTFSQDTIIDQDEKILLTYETGAFGHIITQDGKRLSSQDIRLTYQNYPEALSKFNSGKTLTVLGSIISIPGAFLFGYGLGSMLTGAEVSAPFLIISGGAMAGGMVMSAFGTKAIKSSINIYNEQINNEIALNLNLEMTQHGIGLCLRF